MQAWALDEAAGDDESSDRAPSLFFFGGGVGAKFPAAADVVPLQSLGVVDVARSDLSDTSLLSHALENVSLQDRFFGFAVKRSGDFVNEYARVDEHGVRTDGSSEDNPNHVYGSFPCLFPYGRGGFEVRRPRDVPYQEHVRWAILYSDKRFRKDFYFVFQAFSVLQKRQVGASAKLQIRRSSFLKTQHLLQSLTTKDLKAACEEERRRLPHSNPAVVALKRNVTAVRSKVMGTDESRIAMRSKVWGLTVMKNPPALWITINPADTQDPIVQVLAGEEIDLSNFDRLTGPNGHARSKVVAEDPYAAAKFFHVIIPAILESLFGIVVPKTNGKIRRRRGILGEVEAYVAAAEAQGRGTLHLHGLLWLKGAPSPSAMKNLLSQETFRSRVAEYIGKTIHADLDRLDREGIELLPKEKAPAYSRPPDPRHDGFEEKSRQIERSVARSVQLHRN